MRFILSFLLIQLLLPSIGFVQINVFETNCLELDQNEFDSSSEEIRAGCINTPTDGSSHVFTPSAENKKMIASKQIVFNPNVIIEPTGSHSVEAYIDNSIDVVAYVDDLNSIEKLSKFELGIKPSSNIMEQIEHFLEDSGANKLNPFLSSEIEIYAEFNFIHNLPPSMPINDKVKRHAFYYEEVERDISGFEDLYNHPYFDTPDPISRSDYENLDRNWDVKKSEYPFRIRFSPEYEGEWTCEITIIKNGVITYNSPKFMFEVVSSDNKGFVEVGQSKRFLVRDGKTYMPSGMNFPFISRSGYPLLERTDGNKIMNKAGRYHVTPPLEFYEQGLRYMDTMAMMGVNHFRFIMDPSSSEIEWEELGNYSHRQHIAKELDLVIEKAEEHNLLINWNLSLHFRFCENLFGYNRWDWTIGNASSDDPGDPYNHGLDLNDIKEFFTDKDAKAYWKERLRYIIARWGYTPQIAMFELLSEIDQVGKKLDSDGIIFQDAFYEDDPVTFQNWHLEMADYLKNDLGLRNLLTASYTVGGIDDELDNTFSSSNIDLVSINRYNFQTSNVHDFHRRNIGFLVSDEGHDMPADFTTFHWQKYYNKPIFFSESGATELWECDNHIETRRNIWQNAFWGIAGALDWEIEQLYNHPNATPKVWSIYERVAEFFDDVDLDGENWHSGMTRLRSNGNLRFNKSYRDDCIRDDELADVVYLRSGDKEKAFGVITNRRANYYTLGVGNCKDEGKIPKPVHSDDNFPFSEGDSLLQHYGSVSPGNFNNRLRIRNMRPGFLGLKEYKIKYYSPYDLINSIKEETRFGSQHTLDFPDMDTLDIILFEVFPIGENFKSMATDTTNSDDSLTREPKTEKKDDVKVYPNPNDGKFVVFIESPSEVSLIRVLDNLGKIIDTRAVVNNTNQYNINNFNSGSYFIEVIFNDKIVRKKLVVN